ncbi:arylamine N-acetyltransferase family protein [Mesoterricola sediminis]|uniref:Arylamine N-acetyltransferase n=1 Tax=Mesoterricola sediminis TaxID=2927980 RepID=A0AA48H1K2_9BACT|nr:arylamine N-acetyltransferase [Mesoterricola sediminis]BDU75796.1 arylamine N-acetyltransferase [Mesoterricola sediminis]
MPMVLDPGEQVDLPSYVRRIGYRGPLEANLACLEALCLAHVAIIPFENLDPLAGVPVELDPAALAAKLVDRRRGGYCFEQNLLFGAILERLGFPVALREARVVRGAPEGVTLPRTHGVLEVEADGQAWLVDVGFGSDGLLGPVPMAGAPVRRFDETWQLEPGEGPRRLRADLGGGWAGIYDLQPGRVLLVDWKMASHFTATYPESRFRLTLTMQRTAPGGRRALRGLTWQAPGAPPRPVALADLPALARAEFGLDLTPEQLAVISKIYKDAV